MLGLADRAVAHPRMRTGSRADPGREIHRRREEVAVGQPVDERRLREHLRRDRLAAHDHVERGLHADQPRQPLRAAGAGKQAQLYFGQAELRVLVHHAVVAAQRQLQPAAERKPGDRSDHRLGRILERGDHVQQRWRLEHRGRAELLDVGAGGERAVAADQHDRASGSVRDGAVERLDQLLPERMAQAVHGRIRERENRHPVAQRVFDVLHDAFPAWCMNGRSASVTAGLPSTAGTGVRGAV